MSKTSNIIKFNKITIVNDEIDNFKLINELVEVSINDDELIGRVIHSNSSVNRLVNGVFKQCKGYTVKLLDNDNYVYRYAVENL